MLADGGEAIADIDVLRHQSSVLGPVASPPTVWRTLGEVTPGRLKKIQTARARVRRHLWSQLPGGVPASKVAGTYLRDDLIVLDVDATIVLTHSEKEQAAATFKRTFGGSSNLSGVWLCSCCGLFSSSGEGDVDQYAGGSCPCCGIRMRRAWCS